MKPTLHVLAAALSLALCGNALAQAKPADVGDFPNKPIRFLIGFLPGGVSDTIARVVSDRMSKELGQRVIIDTRPGAGGVLAMELTVNAPADGYTWYLGQPVLGISKLFKHKPSFDPLTALAPVSLLGIGPSVLVAHPSLPVKTVKELIAFGRAQKEPLQYGSSGAGSTNHFSGALLSILGKVPLAHVPYKAAAANTVAVLSGEIPLAFQPLAAAVPHIQAKRLKGIAVTGGKRSRAVPDIPTVGETIPGFKDESWYGIVVPEKTPQAIINYINAVTNKVLAMPDVVDTLMKRGVEVEGSTPQAFGAIIVEDAQLRARVAKQAGIQFD